MSSQQSIQEIRDCKLCFNIHVDILCKKINRKLHTLARATPYMSLSKNHIFLNAFLKSQFLNCPLLWMFDSRALNRKINRIHEKCLRISIQALLSYLRQICFYTQYKVLFDRNLQSFKQHISNDIFKVAPFPNTMSNFNLHQRSKFTVPLTNSVYSGAESISFLGPKIWEPVPSELIEKKLDAFKLTALKFSLQVA